jgi:hypothetical protein
MEKLNSSENPEPSNAAEQDALAEERFIALYTELTGASESQARSVYMYSDIIQQQNLDCYHLE